MTSRQLNRRHLLLGFGAAAVAAGCGSGSKATTTTVTSSEPRMLAPFFATGQREPPILRTGTMQRMPWGLADADGVALSEVPSSLTFTILHEQDPVGSPITVNRHDDGVPKPYYPVRFMVTEPGVYTVSTTVAAGNTLTMDVVVTTPESVRLVQPGEKAIPVETPTTTDARGVTPICTADPPCGFHEVSLASALGGGKPVAFLISTPQFCQTNVCGPVLDMLTKAAAERPDLVAIHNEVYADVGITGDPLKSKLAEAVDAYGLTFEPSLLIIDGSGVVVDRLDFTWDAVELAASLDKVTG